LEIFRARAISSLNPWFVETDLLHRESLVAVERFWMFVKVVPDFLQRYRFSLVALKM
jgi:hypothetical protein